MKYAHSFADPVAQYTAPDICIFIRNHKRSYNRHGRSVFGTCHEQYDANRARVQIETARAMDISLANYLMYYGDIE